MAAADVTVNGLILTFVRATYGAMPHGAKRLARAADTTTRAAENWIAGINGPSVEPLVNLLVVHPDLKARLDDHIADRRRHLDASAVAAERSRQRLACGR